MRRCCSLILVVVLAPALASAQTAVQIPMQFNFINPGAKSLALGGAFVGLADDATAGFANPAGLRDLFAPEISFEIRGSRLESPFLQRGRLSGTIENVKNDVIQGPVFGDAIDSRTGLAYIAGVYARPGRKWSIAGFRHELARVDQQYLSEGVFQKDPSELTSFRDFPQEGKRQLAITNYAAAGAVELSSRVAVGGTLNIYTFDLESQFVRFDTDGFSGPPILTTEVGRSTQDGDGVSVAPTVGVRACIRECADRAKPALRGGFVYRHGPTFSFDTQDGPNHRTDSRFRVPHVLAFGAALEVPQPGRPEPGTDTPTAGRRLLFMAEVTRILSSRLVEQFITDQALAAGVASNVFIDDGTEFHFGFQYLDEKRAWRPRYRAGFWSDPDHSVNFETFDVPADASTRLLHERMSVALAPGERVTHYAGGIGLTVHDQVEVNVGGDFASGSTTISTSLVLKLTK
jgi:long-chain fatty acid transport protein